MSVWELYPHTFTALYVFFICSVARAYREKFQKLTTTLRSLNIFHFIAAFAVSRVIEQQVLE